MIDAALFDRFPLDASGPRYAVARINREGGRHVAHLSEDAAKRARILDRLSRALCKEWDHRMRRIADERARGRARKRLSAAGCTEATPAIGSARR